MRNLGMHRTKKGEGDEHHDPFVHLFQRSASMAAQAAIETPHSNRQYTLAPGSNRNAAFKHGDP